jgi:hypothetical protein
MNGMELAAGGLFFVGAFVCAFVIMCCLIVGGRAERDLDGDE